MRFGALSQIDEEVLFPMKKLFIMSHGLSANGIDSFVVNIVKGFNREKYDISVVLALDEGVRQLREDEVLEAGAKIYRTCDLGSIKRMLIHAKKLYRILKEHKPDIFHTNMDLLNGINLSIAWLAGVPVRVCHSHTSSSQYEEKKGKHFAVGIYRFAMKKLCGLFANKKCGCSSNAMEYLYNRNWESKKHTYIVNNGIDTLKYSKSPRTPYTNGKHTIITVGRLSNTKNPFFALNVIEALYKIRQDFVYIWVGVGDLLDAVQNMIVEKGLQECAFLAGVRNDVEDVLYRCDVFLLPSLFEGLPIALIEAQAAGLPCVISDTITREIDCGACHFESLDEPASHWAQALSDIMDGKISYMIDPEKLEKFDTSYTIKQLEATYEE